MIDWGWIQRNLAMIGGLLAEHVVLSIVPVIAAFVVSIPLGYLVFRTGRFANVVLAVFGVIYSIPSLALFVVMPVILHSKILDPVNVAAALTIYSIALLVRSVVDGLRSVPAAVNSSAAAVGFGRIRRLAPGRAATGDAGDLRRAQGGDRLQHRSGERRCGDRDRRPR